MAKWKLSRLIFGKEEFTFTEGDEVTVGRGVNNKIILSSLLVSRNHCVLSAKKDEVFLTDLKSSNGIFVGTKKIPSNIPTKLKTSDVIGFGLTGDSSFPNVNDNEKYVFKLTREETTLADRIVFQNEDDDINEALLNFKMGSSNANGESHSPIIGMKPQLKRKIDQGKENVHLQNNLSDSKPVCDNKVNNIKTEPNPDTKPLFKKVKVETVNNEDVVAVSAEEINKGENDLEFEAFDIKREYLSQDDDLIEINSDDDSDSDSEWKLRLSQSSPGKPFTRTSNRHIEAVKDFHKEDSSYSQMDDEIENNMFHLEEVDEDEEYVTDLISIPHPPPDYNNDENHDDLFITEKVLTTEAMPILEPPSEKTDATNIPDNDVVDGYTTAIPAQSEQNKDPIEVTYYNTEEKKLAHPVAPRRIAKMMSAELGLSVKASSQPSAKTAKTKSSSRKNKKSSPLKRTITNSQKEERKRKLKAIAEKNRDQSEQGSVASTTSDENKKSSNTINVKVTNTNRTMKMAELPQVISEKPKQEAQTKIRSLDNKLENQIRKERNHSESKSIKLIDEKDSDSLSNKLNLNNSSKSKSPKDKVPVKSLKPLTDSKDSLPGKPLSKVQPLPQRIPKKSVRFSEAAPEVREFEIEPGNRMRKTSLIKTTLVDIQHRPIFSLEKISLMRILRWNPSWLEEQLKNHEPPPILGHVNEPKPLFHVFESHTKYVQQVGDLLLMEVWENLSLAHAKATKTPHLFLSMTIDSLPPEPQPERCIDIINITVNVSLPNTEIKNLPNVGDILLVSFGIESTRRFVYVHNVKCLPSPPRNLSFYNLNLQATFTQKMSVLKQGDIMKAVNLGRISNEMNLFEAMGYLATSPLIDAILRPEPRHFAPNDVSSKDIRPPVNFKWTVTLNESQMQAVTSSVAAALGDRPCLQMIQGPPGTGKSSVICSILMTYFYDEKGERHPNRGKILICATSNAAVDGLVLKLLNIRQKLPKPQRFRMVRVGRLEAMHDSARDLSSQQLAQREVQREAQRPLPVNNGGTAVEEISLLNAKINKWKTLARDAKDPSRAAFCEGRVKELEKRRQKVSGGAQAAGPGPGCEQLVAVERRIVEGADIIATTLASVHNHKLRGLKRRIALCIIDEAGQAIEPEALLPLTLDVTKITLVGDPQQLPGYICSQRAKRLGLGESLFSRLSSCAETWPQSAVQLLDTQYRMQQHIANYPNRAFYDGLVRDRPPPRPQLPCAPYTVLGIASGDKGQATRGENEMEAWGVVRVAAALFVALRGHRLAFAVITPYLAQRDSIRRKLRTLLDPSDGSVEVNTVDSFQGQERDVVIVSLARSHGMGFVADAGRMNVLLTRARHALVVCLNPRAVQCNEQWRTLLEDAQRRNLYKALPNSVCQPAGPISDDVILSYISSNQNKNRSNR